MASAAADTSCFTASGAPLQPEKQQKLEPLPLDQTPVLGLTRAVGQDTDESGTGCSDGRLKSPVRRGPMSLQELRRARLVGRMASAAADASCSTAFWEVLIPAKTQWPGNPRATTVLNGSRTSTPRSRHRTRTPTVGKASSASRSNIDDCYDRELGQRLWADVSPQSTRSYSQRPSGRRQVEVVHFPLPGRPPSAPCCGAPVPGRHLGRGSPEPTSFRVGDSDIVATDRVESIQSERELMRSKAGFRQMHMVQLAPSGHSAGDAICAPLPPSELRTRGPAPGRHFRKGGLPPTSTGGNGLSSVADVAEYVCLETCSNELAAELATDCERCLRFSPTTSAAASPRSISSS
mmetsp:Transcript_70774/g.183680  ORF Transcript_70774/g.183680 Transcript_70774/m.183680 type:complete len:349 (-) Transcript_70774:428-1474(-)